MINYIVFSYLLLCDKSFVASSDSVWLDILYATKGLGFFGLF